MKDPATIFEDTLLQKQLEIAERIVDVQYSRKPEFWKTFGPEGKKISIRDAAYHLPFLAQSVSEKDHDIFNGYVLWVKQLFRGLNFPDDTMKQTLECTAGVLKEYFDPAMHPVFMPYIESGISAMDNPLPVSGSYIDTSTETGKIAGDYINALLAGDRKGASDLVMKALDEGMTVKTIYLEIFQKSQYEVGRLWLDNTISVATEHFCSAATQSIMSQLYPYIFSTERIGRTFVAACIGGELHEIGVRMVSDFFEMEGWDTYYLGANTPVSSIIKAARGKNADIIGLSASMPYHRSLLKKAIEQIKDSSDCRGIKVMIGGNAVNLKKENWTDFGADGYASDAQNALVSADELISRGL